MNRKKKIHEESPVKKCRTKRIRSEQKKVIQGTFKAEISIKDICDETSSGGSSWVSVSGKSLHSAVTDDSVFASSTKIISGVEEETHPSPETFRRSEPHRDELSPTLVYGNWDGSPKRSKADVILPSPERNTHSRKADVILPSPERSTHSNDKPREVLCSTRFDNSKIPSFFPPEEADCVSSVSSNIIGSNEAEDQLNAGLKSKLPGKSDEKLRKILCSSRIDNAKIPSIFRPEETDVVSSISCNVSGNNKAEYQLNAELNSKLSGNAMPCEKSPEKITIPEEKRKKTSRLKKNKQHLQKGNSLEVSLRSTKKATFIHSLNLSQSSKSGEATREKQVKNIGHVLFQVTDEDDLRENQNDILCKNSSEKRAFTKEKRRKDSQAKDVTQDLETRSFVKTPVRLSEMYQISHPENLIPSNKNKEVLPQVINEEDLCVTPKSRRQPQSSKGVIKHRKRTILQCDEINPEMTQEIGLPKLGRKNVSKLKRKLNDVFTTSVLAEHSVEHRPITESRKSIGLALSLRNSGSNADEALESNEAFDKHKQTISQYEKLETTQKAVLPKLKGKNLSKMRAKNKEKLKRKMNDIFPASVIAECSVEQLSITESRESISRARSFRHSKDNADESPESTFFNNVQHPKTSVASKPLKGKKKQKKRQSHKNSLEEEVSTVSSLQSVKYFIVYSESEGSAEAASLHSEKSLKNTRKNVTHTLVKGKKNPKEGIPNDGSSEEEIVSTPSSSTLTEDNYEFMNTSESEASSSKTSETSTQFLEKIGMLEDPVDSVEIHRSKLSKSVKNCQNYIWDEESWDGKPISEKIREYKKYLQTITICDLSLKFCTDKKERKH